MKGRNMVRKVKHAGLKHEGQCHQIPFGSDNRFTLCEICGTPRFYPDGYKGEVAWVRAPKSKK